MSYVDKVLSAGETVVYRGALHWIVYASGLVLAALAIGAGVAASLLPDGPKRTVLLTAATIVLALGLLQLIIAWARSSATEIVVTSQRVICKVGVISVRSVEMNRDKIESVIVDQDLLGRMIDYGTVVIRGTGAGLEPVALLANPLEFRRQVTG